MADMKKLMEALATHVQNGAQSLNDLAEQTKASAAIASAKFGQPAGYQPTEADISEFNQAGNAAEEMAMTMPGALNVIKAPTSAAAVAASNAMGKSPWGKVLMVPNNTKKGYAEGGEVDNTNWMGLDMNKAQAELSPEQRQAFGIDPRPAFNQDPAVLANPLGGGNGASAPLNSMSTAAVAPAVDAQQATAALDASIPTNVNLAAPQDAQAPQVQGAQQSALGTMPGMGDYAAGVNKEAAALGQAGNEQAAAAQQEQQRMADLQQSFQKNQSALEAERNHIMDDIKNGHIDPNRFVGAMGTSAKVSTAIGLLLSGFGAGLTGKENMAQAYLNKQIDNDIDAQKAELGKNHNLLSATMQQFGNLRDATQMARVITTDMYASQIAEAAAKSQDPVAKARAQQAIAQMKMAVQPQLQQLAAKQTLMQGLKSGAVKTSQAIPLLVPDHDRNKAYEEMQSVENATKGNQIITDALNQMAKINTVGNRVTSPLQSRSQLHALAVNTMAQLHPILGVLSEGDKKIAEAANPAVTDSPETIMTKINTMRNLVSSKAGSTPVLDSYGIPVDKRGLQPLRAPLPGMKVKGR